MPHNIKLLKEFNSIIDKLASAMAALVIRITYRFEHLSLI